MANPIKGMHYSDVHHKLKHYESTKTWNNSLKASMINQVRIHEGDGAAKELHKEFSEKRNYNCSGNMQSGYGETKKLTQQEKKNDGWHEVRAGVWRKTY